MGIRIAVLDTGVTEEYRKYLKDAMVVDGIYGVRRQGRISEDGFFHGTYCAAIIRKYFGEAELSSIQILDEKGRGTVEKLAPAFEWCLKQGISIVNVSFGTTNFRDREYLLRLVDYYTARGLVVIAASANTGFTTYPASFSSVIGVERREKAPGTEQQGIRKWDGDFASCCLRSGNLHTGVEILAPSVHEVKIGGRRIFTTQSNSYAAPFVTAWAGTLLKKYPGIQTEQLVRKMCSMIEGVAPLLPVEEEEVPVVVLSVTDSEGMQTLLQQICAFFREDGYHAYALQVEKNKILCGIGYHKMIFSKKRSRRGEVKQFLRNEIFYKKCDILVAMVEKESMDREKKCMSSGDIFLEVEGSYKKVGWEMRKLYEEILGKLIDGNYCEMSTNGKERTDE